MQIKIIQKSLVGHAAREQTKIKSSKTTYPGWLKQKMDLLYNLKWIYIHS
jgi:hypothetical protein